jgi:hypothetical protein
LPQRFAPHCSWPTLRSVANERLNTAAAAVTASLASAGAAEAVVAARSAPFSQGEQKPQIIFACAAHGN